MTAARTARYPRQLLVLAALCTSPLLYAQSLQIVTESLPPATAGTPYSQPLTTTGGTCPAAGDATSRIDAGALPPGISVVSPPSTKQWSLQGTPTASGTFTFTLRVTWTHARISPFDHDCSDDAT